MLLFFVASALNHITVEKCKKLNLPILYIVTEGNKRISKKESYVNANYVLDEFYGKCKIRGTETQLGLRGSFTRSLIFCLWKKMRRWPGFRAEKNGF